MYNKGKNKANSTRIDTLIGQYTHVKGDISFSGGLRIDGSIAGNISAAGDNDSVLTLSEQGSIEGEVKVPHIIINGSISGNVYATKHIELAPQAKVLGNVYYHLLEMAVGAEVNGQLIRMTQKNDTIIDLIIEEDDNNTFQLEQKANLD
jgi:cytoskeletal protein CcmA (bactofilin family)